MTNINWNDVEKWNKDYVLKCFTTEEEYGTTFIERTEGDYLITPEGDRLLDFCNQLFCVNAGQNVPEVQETIREATERYGFLWDVYTTDYKAETAKILCEDIPGLNKWAKKVRFTLGGGDSVETAITIARLVSGKSMIATREHAYHGVTGNAVSCTRMAPSRNHASFANEPTKQVAGTDFGGTFCCPAPHCYRCSLGHTYPACKGALPGGVLPCVYQTEQTLLGHNLDRVAALITEPAHGAGTIMPPMEYLPQIQEMVRRLNIIWIVDEVLMGFGRLGEWMGHQYYGDIEPDMITIAKGLTSSAMPTGAVILGDKIASYMENIRWNHVSTFSGHPLAMAAAKANLQYMLKNDVPGQCKQAGEYFTAKLHELEEKHPTIGLVAGAGMFYQVELVKNRETREPFIPVDRFTSFTGDCSDYPVKIVGAKCAEKGVLLTGFAPNTLRIGASCTVSNADMDKAIDALDYALDYLDTLI